jgi:hypothetical protein
MLLANVAAEDKHPSSARFKNFISASWAKRLILPDRMTVEEIERAAREDRDA